MPKKVRPAGNDWRLKVRTLKVKWVRSIVNINSVAPASGMSGVHKGYEQGNCSSVFAGSTRISLLILLVNYI